MKILKDIFSGDELGSDALPTKEVDGIVLELETKNLSKTLGANFDIGSNPSQEEGVETESYDETKVTVNNLVDNHHLVQTTYDKKAYMGHIKAYMKRLVDHLKATQPDRVEAFQKSAQEFVKKIIANFENYDFYTGESMDPETMVLLKFYKEDGVIPYFYVWKDGIKEENVN